MEDNQKKKAQQPEATIDFGAIWGAILKYKKLYYKTLGVAFVLALIIGFSLPKTYNCKILLAPALVLVLVVKEAMPLRRTCILN